MKSLIPDAELSKYLSEQKVRDANVSTLRERLENFIEEWFYECAIPNKWFDETEDEPFISWGNIYMMEAWRREQAIAKLSITQRRNRLRKILANRMERAKKQYPKTYDGHPEVYERNLNFFMVLADNYNPPKGT